MDTYQEALELAQSMTEAGTPSSVGGTFRDGKPVYFVHPQEASSDEVRDLAFHAKYGHVPSRAESLLGSYADSAMPLSLPAFKVG